MRKLLIVCLIIFIQGTLSLSAQVHTERDSLIVETDSIKVEKIEPKYENIDEYSGNRVIDISDDFVQVPVDSTITIQEEKIKLVEPFRPKPKKAVLYALVPGMGQVYNRKYWKLPIVYGGFIGLTYAISWNGGMYNDYKNAFKDLATGNGDSWKDIIKNPEMREQIMNNESVRRTRLDQFKRNRDNFRRNRDLAIICTFAFYALTVLDAYVDAELYDFDVSPDLSMHVMPVLNVTPQTGATVGVQCTVFF